jgi:hypothetical protein
MFSVKADFKMSDVEAYIKAETEAFFDEMVETFRQQGREFTEKARAKTKAEGSFGNVTYNLRSSIGYCLMYEGKIVESYFPAIIGGTEGQEVGTELAERLATYGDHGDAIVIVLVAGENYASFVQAKGYDVIDSSTTAFETELKQLLAA